MAGFPFPSTVRAVFFDAVGTLIHPHPPAAVVYEQAGRRHGSRLSLDTITTRFKQAWQEEEAFDRQSGWQTGERRERERWQRIVASVLDDVADRKACFTELFGHFALPSAWRCTPEAGAVLKKLTTQGLIVGLASNFDARLRSVAAGIDAMQSLHHLIISSEVGYRKPARQFFAAVCRTAELSPEQVVFVGDDLDNDYAGAEAAGLHAVWYAPDGDAPRADMRVIHRLTDLL